MDLKTCIPRRRDGLLERDTGDAVVVMAQTGEVLHTLRGTGLFIWKMVDGSNSAATILERILEEYDVGKERATADMDAFLRALAENNLISL